MKGEKEGGEGGIEREGRIYLDVAAVAEQEKALTRLEEKYSRIQLTKVVEKYGTPKVRE